MKYTRLIAAIRDLAPTNEKRAEKLGISVRMLMYYLAGAHVPTVEILARAGDPRLFNAARDDAMEHYHAAIVTERALDEHVVSVA